MRGHDSAGSDGFRSQVVICKDQLVGECVARQHRMVA